MRTNFDVEREGRGAALATLRSGYSCEFLINLHANQKILVGVRQTYTIGRTHKLQAQRTKAYTNNFDERYKFPAGCKIDVYRNI